MSWWHKLNRSRSSPISSRKHLHTPGALPASLEALENRRLLHAGLDVWVNFQPHNAPAPDGYFVDAGGPYTLKSSSDGFARYGWTFNDGAWQNSWTGERSTPMDARHDTFISLGHRPGLAWEMSVPSGMYNVTLAVGDPVFRAGEFHRIAVEGQVVLEHTATAAQPTRVQTVEVEVTDGRLTITAPDGMANTKLAWLRIESVHDHNGGGDNGGGDNGGGDNGGGDNGGGDNGGGDNGGGDNGGGGSSTVNLGTFEARAAMPYAVSEGGSAVLDGTVYVWGGYDQPNIWISTTRGQAYDAATNQWRQIAPLPQPLTHFQAVPYEGKIYVFGGFVNAPPANGGRDAVYVYDPATDSFSNFTTMPEAVSGHGATMVGSRVYIVSGMLRQGYNFLANTNKVFSLDMDNPAAGWRAEPDLPVGRDHTAAVTINGMIYLVSGQLNDDHIGGARPEVYRFDPQDPGWTRVADMPDGGRGHIGNSVVVYNNQILVVGGNRNAATASATYDDDVYLYDPATDTWSHLGNLPAKRMAGSAHVVNGHLYYFGGFDGIPRGNVWRAPLTLS